MILLRTPCIGQKKYEREYSIRSNTVPEKALRFVSSAFKNTKIHWYAEESLTEKTIEAKFRNSGKRYSIEFDKSGEIQDIETLITVNQIDTKIQATLRDNLSKKFSKYKIIKTQLHWKGKENELKEALLADQLPRGVVTKYELIIRATKDKKENYFEVQSEKNGTIESIKEIVQRNADNLIY